MRALSRNSTCKLEARGCSARKLSNALMDAVRHHSWASTLRVSATTATCRCGMGRRRPLMSRTSPFSQLTYLVIIAERHPAYSLRVARRSTRLRRVAEALVKEVRQRPRSYQFDVIGRSAADHRKVSIKNIGRKQPRAQRYPGCGQRRLQRRDHRSAVIRLVTSARSRLLMRRGQWTFSCSRSSRRTRMLGSHWPTSAA